MATNVVMPQMGESIAEGTIVRWIKKVGDAVDRDEPLFEISTDKVDAEIPSPAAGVLTDIKVKEGETVPVNSVVAVIGADGEKPSAQPAQAQPAAAAPPAATSVDTSTPMPAAAVGQPETPPASGHRHQRTRHQARHPRLPRVWRSEAGAVVGTVAADARPCVPAR